MQFLKNKPLSKIDGILQRLNVMERKVLVDYINMQVQAEKIKLYEEEQKKMEQEILTMRQLCNAAWDSMDECITIALRENHVSKERMERIFARLSELMQETEGKSWFDLDKMPESKFEIITKDEWKDIISELIEVNCKGCIKSNKDCYCYRVLKKHEVAAPSGYQRRCRYAY